MHITIIQDVDKKFDKINDILVQTIFLGLKVVEGRFVLIE